MSTSFLYKFETASTDCQVDADQAIITGVSLITGNVTARGHGLEVDEKTLKQIYLCAKGKGQVPVKTNHGSGVDAVNGYLTNFKIDGNKVRGDWHLLKSYEKTPHHLEVAERMPGSVGLSVAFHGDPELEDGTKCFWGETLPPDALGAHKPKQYFMRGTGTSYTPVPATEKIFARCAELVSTDLVATPAANPDGMFAEGSRVDSASGDMANTATPSSASPAAATAEPTLADVMKAIQGLTQRMDTIEAGHVEPDGDELSDEEIEAGLKEGWLTDNGDGTYSVNAENADDEDVEEAPASSKAETVEAAEHEAAAALARGDAPTYFAALDRAKDLRITALEARLEKQDADKRHAVEQAAVTAFEAKVTKLTEFASQLQQENAAMAELIKELRASGGSRKLPSASASEKLFSANAAAEGRHEFEVKVAERVTELHKSMPNASEFDIKGTALSQVMKENTELYADYNRKRGITHS